MRYCSDSHPSSFDYPDLINILGRRGRLSVATVCVVPNTLCSVREISDQQIGLKCAVAGIWTQTRIGHFGLRLDIDLGSTRFNQRTLSKSLSAEIISSRPFLLMTTAWRQSYGLMCVSPNLASFSSVGWFDREHFDSERENGTNFSLCFTREPVFPHGACHLDWHERRRRGLQLVRAILRRILEQDSPNTLSMILA